MDELRNIIGNLTDIECGMESIESILIALQEHYEFKQENVAYANVNVFMREICALHKELSNEITKLDSFVLSQKNNN